MRKNQSNVLLALLINKKCPSVFQTKKMLKNQNIHFTIVATQFQLINQKNSNGKKPQLIYKASIRGFEQCPYLFLRSSIPIPNQPPLIVDHA